MNTEWPYTREFYYSRGRKDRLEGRRYRPGQHDGWQGRAYKDGWAQALTLEKLAESPCPVRQGLGGHAGGLVGRLPHPQRLGLQPKESHNEDRLCRTL